MDDFFIISRIGRIGRGKLANITHLIKACSIIMSSRLHISNLTSSLQRNAKTDEDSVGGGEWILKQEIANNSKCLEDDVKMSGKERVCLSCFFISEYSVDML